MRSHCSFLITSLVSVMYERREVQQSLRGLGIANLEATNEGPASYFDFDFDCAVEFCIISTAETESTPKLHLPCLHGSLYLLLMPVSYNLLVPSSFHPSHARVHRDIPVAPFSLPSLFPPFSPSSIIYFLTYLTLLICPTHPHQAAPHLPPPPPYAP